MPRLSRSISLATCSGDILSSNAAVHINISGREILKPLPVIILDVLIFNFFEVRKYSLNFWLNGKRSVGGYSLIHALFSKVGIVSPEALGVIMSQQAAKAMNKFQEERNRRRSADDDNNRQGKNDE